MRLSQKIIGILLAALTALLLFPNLLIDTKAANSFENSNFIGTGLPELSKETQKLFSLYPNTPAENSVKAACGNASLTDTAMEKININSLNCWLYIPKNAAEKMPLIVYLHGASGKGNDLNKLLASGGFVQWLADGTLGEVPAYVLIPQLPSDQKDWLAMKEAVVSAIQEVAATYPIDSSNINLTGFSMGGAGVWIIAASYPELFHCIAPCSGSLRVNKATLSALSNMKIWTFIGTADTEVNPQATINFMEQLAQNNTQAVMTEFDGAGHKDVPALVYLSEEIDLIHWLIGE